MILLNNMLASEFMKLNPEVKIIVEGDGTSEGAQAIAKGKADICAASRKLLPNEIKIIADEFRTLGVSVLVGKDALSVYLNTQNPIDDLSFKDLRSIFKCEIMNWTEIDGDYALIQRALRDKESGTYTYFRRIVLETDEYCAENVWSFSTTQEIINYVANNRYSIGYGGIAYHDSVKHASINGIIPSVENVRNDKYPIIRYLHFYTADTPKGKVKKFIDFVLSEKGQEIVSKTGFISLW